jgi:gliding motility-associated-like protein
MKYISALSFSLIFTSAFGQFEENPWSREHIQYLIQTGQFDKAAHDAYFASIHEPGLPDENRSTNCGCYEEPDATYTLIPNNQFAPNALDGYFGPVNIPFAFNNFGQTYNSLHINTKGTVSFNGPNTTFIPVGFPTGTAMHNMVAGYWADIDIRGAGSIYYKITPNALFVNFVEVGYYNFHSGLKNTFQIIITDGTYEPIGIGNNVALCYKTMQWAMGDWNNPVGGGQGPTNTTAGGTVGSNRPNAGHVQFGRFAFLNSNYDGPYGTNDGVHWLTDKSFKYNSAVTNANIPPIFTLDPSCDTIKVCINDVYTLSINANAPEQNQNVTITVDASGVSSGWTQTVLTSGSSANLQGTFTGSFSNVGVHVLTVTATDNGNPAQTSSVQYIFEVIPVVIPPLTVSGNLTFCAGSSTVMTASPGFDFYNWSNGCATPSCTYTNGGTHFVTGNIQGCTATATFTLTVIPPQILALTITPEYICSLDSSLVCVTLAQNYVDFDISVYVPNPPNGLSFTGTIYGETDQSCAQLGVGTYIYKAWLPDGCMHQRIFNIYGIDATIPEDVFSGTYCEDLQPVDFEDGFYNPQTGPLWFYFFQGYSGQGWNSGYLQLVINGDTLTNIFSTGLPFFTISNTITYGQYLQVIYVPGPGEINSQGQFTGSPNGLTIINCGGQNIAYQCAATPGNPSAGCLQPGIIWEGWSACTAEPAYGQWNLVNGPPGTFSNTSQFNTTFTPSGYGVYELCFTDEICDQLRCYELEFNESPTLSIAPEGVVSICAGEVVDVVATPTSPLGDAQVTWTPGGIVSNEISLTQGGIYTATAANNCGSASQSIEIDIAPVPNVALPGQFTGCVGDTFVLDPVENDDPNFTYSWTGPGVTGLTTPAVTVSQSGTYTVTVQDGCSATTVSSVISLGPPPNAVLPANISGCSTGIVLDPIANDDPDFTYSWTGPGVQGSSASTVTVTQSGTYTVTVSGSCGQGQASSNVTIIPNPTAILQAVINNCTGSVVLDPTNPDHPSFVYAWTGPGVQGSTAPSVTVTQSGTYQVTVSNDCGQVNASSSVTIAADVPPVLPPVVNDCSGGPVTLTVQPNLGDYLWSPGGQNTNSIEVTSGGTYSVTVTNICGSNTASTNVTIGSGPGVTIAIDTLFICPGIVENVCDFVTYSSNISNYSWTRNGEAYGNDECFGVRPEDVPADFLELGVTMAVTVANTCGTATDSFVLKPIICNIDEFNVFSPNGDGVNDFFTLGGIDAFKGVVFRVFNRWGVKVYDNSDFGSIPGWDGGDQPAGTYFYICELPNGESRNGAFTLLR